MSKIPSSPSAQYTNHQHQVKKVSDLYDGIDTAKSYLQQYGMEDNTEFNDRQSIATLDNFVFRTVEDIQNIIFRKPLDLSSVKNKTVLDYCEKIDFTNNLNEFGKQVLSNRIRDGFTFILVDSVKTEDQDLTLADQAALGIRPYFVNVLRKNVIGLKTDKFGNYTQVRIKESYEVEDGYDTEIKEQIKVWNIGSIEIWRDQEIYSLEDTKLSVIPIIKVGNNDIPPLYDLAKINIQHMNRDSEVSNYSRIGGAAFLAVFGANAQEGEVKTVGMSDGMQFSDKSTGDVKWIEMEGRNYNMLKDRILYHEEQMKRIAISFTTSQDNKTATQVNKESMTAESKAIDYATELESGLNDVLMLLNEYKVSGSTFGENYILVNKDFDSNILSPEMVTSYRTDYAAGIISFEELRQILAEGEYLKEITEVEMQTIKTQIKDDVNI